MYEKYSKELEDRRSTVEKIDHESILRNSDHFRSYWLQIVILSSAIVIGLVPVIDNPVLVQSPSLAKIGLLVILLVCVSIVLYFQNFLTREKIILYDQQKLHEDNFAKQSSLLKKAKNENWVDKKIEVEFEVSKRRFFEEETNLLFNHLVSNKGAKHISFFDKYFNVFMPYLFATGVFFIVLSFIC